VARMIGHITYMSDQSMNEKFGRRTKDKKHPFKFGPEFEVENYLHYRGYGFTRRFDPNSYLYITKAADFFSLANERAQKLFDNIKTKVLIVAFSGDWLYPPYQSKQIARALKSAGLDVKTHVLRSNYGHDAFLVELEEQTRLYKRFLKKISDAINPTLAPSIVKSFYG
ncbi:MAG: homoserine O-acetyltransferase, partial [Syntrophorhabdus sp.]